MGTFLSKISSFSFTVKLTFVFLACVLLVVTVEVVNYLDLQQSNQVLHSFNYAYLDKVEQDLLMLNQTQNLSLSLQSIEQNKDQATVDSAITKVQKQWALVLPMLQKQKIPHIENFTTNLQKFRIAIYAYLKLAQAKPRNSSKKEIALFNAKKQLAFQEQAQLLSNLRKFIYNVNLLLVSDSQQIQKQALSQTTDLQTTIAQDTTRLIFTLSIAIIAVGLLLFLLIYKKLLSPISNIKECLFRLSQGHTNDTFPTGYESELMPIIEAMHTLKQYVIKVQDIATIEQETREGLEQANKKIQYANTVLQQSMQEKSAFIANISHEVRTPINAILGMSYILEQQVDKKQSNYVAKIKNASTTLLQLVNDIIDLAKLETVRMSFEKIAFNIQDIIDLLKDVLEIKATEKNIDLVFNLDPNVPLFLKGDPLRIKQILLNLLGNAVKFTHTGAVTLYITTTKVKNETNLICKVTDTGIGITKQAQEKIFQPFTQANSATTREYGGSGLGLTISMQLAQAMKGSITLESKLNQGSTFTFTIPIEAASITQINELEANTKKLTNLYFNYQSVLVVEDDPVNQQVAKFLLEEAHLNVTLASSAKQAFDALKAKQYDLILMDWYMPAISGKEAIQSIRANKATQSIPIIILSGKTITAESLAKENITVEGILTKPILKEKLYTELSAHLDINENTATQTTTQANSMLLNLPSCFEQEKALARLGGNVEAYKNLLLLFNQTYQSVPDTLKNLNVPIQEEHIRLMHSLKSACMNIGLQTTATLAQTMEAEFNTQSITQENKKQLIQELETAIQAIATLTSAKEETQSATNDSKLDKKQIQFIQELARFLQNSDAQAIELFNTFKQVAPSFFATDSMQALAKQIQTYEFEAALSILQEKYQPYL